MKKTLEARHHANRQVLNTLNKHEEVYSGIPMMVGAVNQLSVLVNKTSDLMAKVDSVPQKTGGNKSIARTELAAIGHKASNCLKIYSVINKDYNLLNFVVTSLSSLNTRLRNQQLLDYCKALKSHIEPLIETLIPFGLTQEMVQELNEEIQEFEAIMIEPRELVNERKTNNEIIVECIGDASDILDDQLDSFMELFNNNNSFYTEYTGARMIVDPASRSKDVTD